MVNPRDNASQFTWSEEREVRDVLWKIQPGDLVFDVGCGFGAYALSALAVGASHVHCWSLNEAHVALMTETLAVNAWGSRTTLNATGLHGETGWLTDQESCHQVLKVPSPGRFCETLDEYISRLPRVMKLPPFDYHPAARDKTWLKVDTQGDELAILRGAREFIQDYRPTILLKSPGTAALAWLTGTEGPKYKEVARISAFGISHGSFRP